MIETANEAVKHAITWFEVNGGWAPPDHDTLLEWVADGVSLPRRLHRRTRRLVRTRAGVVVADQRGARQY
jgi:hypothetical protein